ASSLDVGRQEGAAPCVRGIAQLRVAGSSAVAIRSLLRGRLQVAAPSGCCVRFTESVTTSGTQELRAPIWRLCVPSNRWRSPTSVARLRRQSAKRDNEIQCRWHTLSCERAV